MGPRGATQRSNFAVMDTCFRGPTPGSLGRTRSWARGVRHLRKTHPDSNSPRIYPGRGESPPCVTSGQENLLLPHRTPEGGLPAQLRQYPLRVRYRPVADTHRPEVQAKSFLGHRQWMSSPPSVSLQSGPRLPTHALFLREDPGVLV